MKQAE